MCVLQVSELMKTPIQVVKVFNLGVTLVIIYCLRGKRICACMTVQTHYGMINIQ